MSTSSFRQKVHVRGYDPADAESLIELFRGSVRQIASRDYTQQQVIAWAPEHIDLQEWATRRASRRTWIATLGGKIVGFIDLEANGNIDMLYVHSEHQRNGIARALLQALMENARAQSLKSVRTESSITARPFFENHGFAIVAKQTVTVRGQNFVNFKMERQL